MTSPISQLLEELDAVYENKLLAENPNLRAQRIKQIRQLIIDAKGAAPVETRISPDPEIVQLASIANMHIARILSCTEALATPSDLWYAQKALLDLLLLTRKPDDGT